MIKILRSLLPILLPLLFSSLFSFLFFPYSSYSHYSSSILLLFLPYSPLILPSLFLKTPETYKPQIPSAIPLTVTLSPSDALQQDAAPPPSRRPPRRDSSPVNPVPSPLPFSTREHPHLPYPTANPHSPPNPTHRPTSTETPSPAFSSPMSRHLRHYPSSPPIRQAAETSPLEAVRPLRSRRSSRPTFSGQPHRSRNPPVKPLTAIPSPPTFSHLLCNQPPSDLKPISFGRGPPIRHPRDPTAYRRISCRHHPCPSPVGTIQRPISLGATVDLRSATVPICPGLLPSPSWRPTGAPSPAEEYLRRHRLLHARLLPSPRLHTCAIFRDLPTPPPVSTDLSHLQWPCRPQP